MNIPWGVSVYVARGVEGRIVHVFYFFLFFVQATTALYTRISRNILKTRKKL